MALSAGQRIGAYEIVSALGAGGMGEVYRARDSKLKREVAIKVLPADVANDRERLARFQREAEVLASLNHPHIAQVYGFENPPEGGHHLIMELVEGEDLAQRIARGPIPIDDALPIAKQIAEALEAAHDAGIVHRDLKPANIKVRDDGTVKVLDFGLAKAMSDEPKGSSPQDFALSPTITSPAMTMRGVILGTAAYMAPEQAKGKAVDKRADIWAFGCVLFEMLTGARAFKGDDVTDIITSVMRDAPDWKSLPDRTPATIRTLLRRCLEKDPRKRAPHIGIARLDIDDALTHTAELVNVRPASGSPFRSRSVAVIACAAIVAALAIGWASSSYFTPEQSPNLRAVRFDLPNDDPRGNLLSVSPDGRYIAHLDLQGGSLLLRALDQSRPRSLTGTEGASAPFWSPDSRFIAFYRDGRLFKVDINGGPPAGIGSTVPDIRAGAWSTQGAMLLAVRGAGETFVIKVNADGSGAQQKMPMPPGTQATNWPCFLPDGRHYLFLAMSSERDSAGVYVADLEGRNFKRILPDVTRVFVASGYLLFMRGNTLMAQSFDSKAGELAGDAIPLIEGVTTNPANGNGTVDVGSQLLAYRTRPTSAGEFQLTWVDRTGSKLGTLGPAGLPTGVALSADGRVVAAHIHDRSGGDLWFFNTAGGAASRFTLDEGRDNASPVWSPDGKSVAFGAKQGSQWSVLIKPVDGSSAERVVVSGLETPLAPMSWSGDGRFILAQRNHPDTGWDIVGLPVNGGPPVPILASADREGFAQVSPDSRWLAYSATARGRAEIFVRSFPEGPVKKQVSTNGGDFPRWRSDGRELFYLTGAEMSAADVNPAGAVIDVSPPRRLFQAQSMTGPVAFHAGNYHPFAVSPDGQRFLLPLVTRPAADESTARMSPISVIVNWTALLAGKK